MSIKTLEIKHRRIFINGVAKLSIKSSNIHKLIAISIQVLTSFDSLTNTFSHFVIYFLAYPGATPNFIRVTRNTVTNCTVFVCHILYIHLSCLIYADMLDISYNMCVIVMIIYMFWSTRFICLNCVRALISTWWCLWCAECWTTHIFFQTIQSIKYFRILAYIYIYMYVSMFTIYINQFQTYMLYM